MTAATEHWQIGKRAVSSQAGVVASQHHLAARAGAGMLARGGTAVDAAVATAFALATVEPWMCGLGGSGYAVVWLAEECQARVVDFQGVLPEKLTPEDYPLDPDVPQTIMGFPGVVDRANVVGPKSATVPGAVAGLAHLLGRYGSLGLDTVLEPSIALARRGLPVDWFTTLQIALSAGDLARNPEAAAIYLPGGHPPQPESHLPMGALADTLTALAEGGPEPFYHGAVGEALVADMASAGSRITMEDLAAYQPLDHESLSGSHRGVVFHTAGETSGGPRLIDFLSHVAEHLQPGNQPDGAAWKVYADALNLAWRQHNARIGRVTEVGGCTTHLSAVDAAGNMVALTYTLLNRFGSCYLSPQTGILLNNSVSYFDPRPGYPTTMAGRKRINASNMCPTIGVRDGEAVFALGASGANFIMPCTAQIAALMLDFGMSLEEAMNHPRIDASDRGSVRVDPRLGPEVLGTLAGHFELEVAQRLVFPKLYSCPSGVTRDPSTGLCRGLNDPSQPIGGAAAAAPFALENMAPAEEPRP